MTYTVQLLIINRSGLNIWDSFTTTQFGYVLFRVYYYFRVGGVTIGGSSVSHFFELRIHSMQISKFAALLVSTIYIFIFLCFDWQFFNGCGEVKGQ